VKGGHDVPVYSELYICRQTIQMIVVTFSAYVAISPTFVLQVKTSDSRLFF